MNAGNPVDPKSIRQTEKDMETVVNHVKPEFDRQVKEGLGPVAKTLSAMTGWILAFLIRCWMVQFLWNRCVWYMVPEAPQYAYWDVVGFILFIWCVLPDRGKRD